MSAKLYVENSMGQVVGVPESILALVRHDLSIAPRAVTVPRPGDVTALEYLVSQEGVFPAGLTTEIERLLKKWGVPAQLNDMRVRPMEDLPLHSGIKLRPYQEKLVERALDLGRGVIDSPPRSGKTRMGAAVIDRNPLPAVWVAPTRGIVQQTVKALKGMLSAGHGDAGVLECMGGWPKSAKGVRAAMAARVVVTTAASAVRFPESFYRTRQVLFVDEVHHCLAPSSGVLTITGWRAIRDIRVGEFVLSVLGEKFAWRRVLNVWRRRPPPTRLRVSVGLTTIEVTDAHEIYSPQGKVKAGDLREGSEIHLLEVREGDSPTWTFCRPRTSLRAQGGYVFTPPVPAMWKGDPTQGPGRARTELQREESVPQSEYASEGNGCAFGEPGVPSIFVRSDEGQEPDGSSKCADAGWVGSEAEDPRWRDGGLRAGGRGQGEGANKSGGSCVAGASPNGVYEGVGCSDRSQARPRSGDLVLDRLCTSSLEDGGGDRRDFAFASKGLGREEGRFSCLPGMAGSSLYEQADPCGNRIAIGRVQQIDRISCEDIEEVFDLEVEESHNYFAEGVLVSNSAANTYADINRLAAPVFHRYGMTGTHFRSDPNTEIKMHAVISEVIGRVSVRELIQLKYLVPADVVFIPISEPNLPPGLDASEAYRRGIVQNRARNAWAAWAAQVLASGGRRVIVLVKHIQHGEILQGLIPGAMFVKGEDGAELDDDGIDMVSRAIGDFNAGKIQILIGTSVLGEGIDLPAADALVYAKGGSASVTVTQDFFRVLTGAEGKYPAVIVDFADRTDDYLLGQAAKRGAIYTREECFNVTVANDVDPEKDLRGVLAPIALLR